MNNRRSKRIENGLLDWSSLEIRTVIYISRSIGNFSQDKPGCDSPQWLSATKFTHKLNANKLLKKDLKIAVGIFRFPAANKQVTNVAKNKFREQKSTLLNCGFRQNSRRQTLKARKFKKKNRDIDEITLVKNKELRFDSKNAAFIVSDTESYTLFNKH